jgi:acetyl esterase/lipase
MTIGANMIIGVDVNSAREAVAPKFGMPDFFNAREVKGDIGQPNPSQSAAPPCRPNIIKRMLERLSEFLNIAARLFRNATSHFSIVKGRIPHRCISIAIVALLPSGIAQAESSSALTVPSRTIPVPETVSPLLQEEIAKGPGADRRNLKIPLSADEWRTAQSETAAELLPYIKRWREHYDVIVDETTIAGVHCYIVMPHSIASRNRNRLLVNLHGGGYVWGGGKSGLLEAIQMAALTGLKVIAVDYSLPPDRPFPAGMNDALAVWRSLVHSHSPASLGLFGTSAGGGMALALVQRAKQEGLPLPAAIMAGTPWSDLSKTGDSYFTNDGVDVGLVTYDGRLKAQAELYANGIDLKDSRLSPVYGDFAGFPPTYLATGTRDLFLSNTVRVYRKLKQAGATVELDVLEAQSHAQYLTLNAPETVDFYANIARFFDCYLATDSK